MNWITQTGHVAAKDVRHTWVQLAAYIVLLTTTAASVVSGRALGPYWPTSSTQVLGAIDVFVIYLPLCTILLGFVMAASLVQADSPTRATAFWASRPLSPSAVLASKLALVFVTVVALPLLAALVALRSFDAGASLTASTLTHAAFVYGEWLMAAMIVAALTDDLRTFIGATVAILVAAAIVLGALSDSTPTNAALDGGAAALVLDIVQAVAFAGGAVLLAYLYRTRQRRRSTWVGGGIITAVLVFGSVASPSEARSAPLALSDGPPLEVAPVDSVTSGQPRSVQVEVAVPLRSDALRLEFRPDTMRIETRQGTEIGRRIGIVSRTIDGSVLPPVGQPVRWLFDQATSAHGRVTYMLDAVEEPAAASGITSVTLGGVVTAYRPHLLASLPLRDGAVAMSRGRRLRIYGFDHGRSSADLYLQVSDVTNGTGDSGFGIPTGGILQFVLVNSARSEAMLIGNAPSSNASGPDWIVLPWIGVSNTFTHFVTNASGHEMLLPQDDAWYRGARLVVVEWVAESRYRTSGKMVTP
ncbi:MAG TPA: hypothetical protein VGM67_13290 [Gemmatimonadaceae bacterium]|jgi:hypothetical protein